MVESPKSADILQKFTKILNTSLGINGYLPSKNGEYNLARMYAFLGVTYMGMAITSYNMYIGWPNMQDITYNTTPLLASALVVVKLTNFLVKRKRFYNLLHFTENTFWKVTENTSNKEKEIIYGYAKYVYITNFVQFLSISGTIPFWILNPLLDMYIFPENNLNGTVANKLPWKIWLPSEIDIYKHPFYEGCYLFEAMCVVCIGVNMMAIDILYVYFILSVCAQYKILQHRIKIFHLDENNQRCDETTQTQNVKNCIKFHQTLLEFCAELESLFSIMLIFQLMQSSLFLCSSGIIVILFPGSTSIYIQSTFCLIAALAQLFLFCLAANTLTTESTAVAFSVYESDWYNAPLGIKKLILFIIVRSQKPIFLTAANFATMSLETFEAVTHTAFSYFTVLTSMRDDE